jgi:hypothetical protein
MILLQSENYILLHKQSKIAPQITTNKSRKLISNHQLIGVTTTIQIDQQNTPRCSPSEEFVKLKQN